MTAPPEVAVVDGQIQIRFHATGEAVVGTPADAEVLEGAVVAGMSVGEARSLAVDLLLAVDGARPRVSVKPVDLSGRLVSVRPYATPSEMRKAAEAVIHGAGVLPEQIRIRLAIDAQMAEERAAWGAEVERLRVIAGESPRSREMARLYDIEAERPELIATIARRDARIAELEARVSALMDERAEIIPASRQLAMDAFSRSWDAAFAKIRADVIEPLEAQIRGLTAQRDSARQEAERSAAGERDRIVTYLRALAGLVAPARADTLRKAACFIASGSATEWEGAADTLDHFGREPDDYLPKVYLTDEIRKKHEGGGK